MAELSASGGNPFTSDKISFRVDGDMLLHLHPFYDPISNSLCWEDPEHTERRRRGAVPFIKPGAVPVAPERNEDQTLSVRPVTTAHLHKDGSVSMYAVTPPEDLSRPTGWKREALRLLSYPDPAEEAETSPAPLVTLDTMKAISDPAVPPGMVVVQDEDGEAAQIVDHFGERVRVYDVGGETLEHAIARVERARPIYEMADRITGMLRGQAKLPPDFANEPWFLAGIRMIDRVQVGMNLSTDMLVWLLPPEVIGIPRDDPAMPAYLFGVRVRVAEGITPHLAIDLTREGL